MKIPAYRLGLFAGLILICASGAFALETAPDSVITLSECLARLNSHSIQVAQALVGELRAQSALDEANRPRLPQLVAQANFLQSSDVVNQAVDSNKAVLRVEQGTLPFFGSAWKLGIQKAAELEVARSAVMESRADAAFLVKQLYFSILRDQDTIEKLNAIELELNRVLNTVLPKFQMGRAPSFDQVKVRSSIYDLSRQRETTLAQLVGEKTQLRQIVGIENGNFKLKEMPADSVPKNESSATQADEKMALRNPTLTGLSLGVDASEASISTASGARLPALSAAFEYGGTGQTATALVRGYNAFVQLRLTLFDWGLISSQVSQAEHATTLARQKLEAEKNRIFTELQTTQALAHAHLADQQRLFKILPEMKRAENAAVERYRRAGIGIIELSDSVSLLLTTLLNERLAYYSYLGDLAHIKRLVGDRWGDNGGDEGVADGGRAP